MNENLEQVATQIVDAAIAVHRELGPGLLESAYQGCLEYELRSRGLRGVREMSMPVVYRNVKIDCGYRIDLVVEDLIIIEIKSVDGLAPIHTAQLLTYLKLSGLKLGFLMNFNVQLMKDGLKRIIH